MKTYEGLFIFPETLKDDGVAVAVGRVKEEITKLDGVIASSTILGKRAFSRLLHKEQAGHYVRIAFEMAPDKLPALTPRLKLIEMLFRFQIVKVVKPAPAAAVAPAPVGAPAAVVAGGASSPKAGETSRGNA